MQNFPKKLLNFICPHVVVIWQKFRPFWTKTEGRESFCVRYPKISFLSGTLWNILPNFRTLNCNKLWTKFWHSVKSSDSGSLRSLKITKHHFLTPDRPCRLKENQTLKFLKPDCTKTLKNKITGCLTYTEQLPTENTQRKLLLVDGS